MLADRLDLTILSRTAATVEVSLQQPDWTEVALLVESGQVRISPELWSLVLTIGQKSSVSVLNLCTRITR